MARRMRWWVMTWGPVGAALLLYAPLVYRTAWLCDDAFISFRTVAHFVDGFGLRWNITERVQTYTHPLWLLLLAAVHAGTGEIFYSALWLSVIVSCAGVVLLVSPLGGPRHHRLLALGVLCCSQAYVDFSTSGLENPLSHLLLISYALVLASPPTPRRYLQLSALAGLAAFNRLDIILLFTPGLLYGFPWRSPRRGLRDLIVGLLPCWGWEIVALIYYGFPFPNTAYAKLAVGHLGGTRLWRFGAQYLTNSWHHDPLTLATMALLVGVALHQRRGVLLAIAAGVLSYVGYIVVMGGDFMAGRFLSAPFVFAVAGLTAAAPARPPRRARWAWPLAGSFVLAGTHPPPTTGANYGTPNSGIPHWDPNGIHDERAVFFPINSLRHARHMNPMMPDHPWAAMGYRLALSGQRVHEVDTIGHAGFFAGPAIHIVDRWALADPLIARIPPIDGRIGHFTRVIPDGYLETLASGENRIADEALSRYYDKLQLVTEGPLWSAARWREIVKLNLGSYDILIDAYAYHRGPAFEPELRAVNPTKYPEVVVYFWNAERVAEYAIHEASQQGYPYGIRWRLELAGPELVSPAGRRLQAFSGGLERQGMFTLGILFRTSGPAALERRYELRYAYFTENDQLVVLRHPESVWVGDATQGQWRYESIREVFSATSD